MAPTSRRYAGVNLSISVRNSASADRRATADWVLPGTSTSTWTERRPEASFFTLMMAPWERISAAIRASAFLVTTTNTHPLTAQCTTRRIIRNLLRSFALGRLRRHREAFLDPRLPQRCLAGDGSGRLIAVEVEAECRHDRAGDGHDVQGG